VSDGVWAALITGLLSLAGVLATLISRRTQGSSLQRLRRELEEAKRAQVQLRVEREKYRMAYLGLLEVTQGLLDKPEQSRPERVS
jgi:hypothetical protein